MDSYFLRNTDGKNSVLKQRILGLCVNEGNYSLADLSRELNSSIPTITKLVGEFIDDGFLVDMGKLDTNGGRRPSIYGLNPSAGYFVGVSVRKESISIAVTDFKGELVSSMETVDFTLENSEASFRDLCNVTKEYLKENAIDKDSVLAYGINLSGRVNYRTGNCFTYDLGEGRSISTILESEMGAPVYLENDSRAMTYGEYICGTNDKVKDMLFVNVTWGLGMGMIIDGKLVYGKSGFSGELGHMPVLDNNQICRCGKFGCLETGASGQALFRMVNEMLRGGNKSMLSDKFNRNEAITIEDILNAIRHEDFLAIEAIEKIGTTLGRALAGIINLFNPELVVIGGCLADATDYLMLPIKAAIQKFSLNIINKDTDIRFSTLGKKAGSIGACILSRSKLLGLL